MAGYLEILRAPGVARIIAAERKAAKLERGSANERRQASAIRREAGGVFINDNSGATERFDRIPSAGPGTDGMQVVIERYEMPDGSARFEVYVTGTVTFDPVALSALQDL